MVDFIQVFSVHDWPAQFEQELQRNRSNFQGSLPSCNLRNIVTLFRMNFGFRLDWNRAGWKSTTVGTPMTIFDAFSTASTKRSFLFRIMLKKKNWAMFFKFLKKLKQSENVKTLGTSLVAIFFFRSSKMKKKWKFLNDFMCVRNNICLNNKW